ncbi:MAG TPA: hypothetical protein PKD45_09790 [Flavobacteriales bacterium]|nr:hypothetical protein [Flavobacteriales bacterium]
MNVRHYRSLLLLALVAPMALCAQQVRVVTRVVTDASPAWKMWKADGMSMNHPGNWSAWAPTQGDTVVVFRQGAVEGQPHASQVAVYVRSMDSMPVLRNDLADATMATAGKETMTAPGTIYEFNKDGVAMRAMEQLVAEDGRPFKLTYMAPRDVYEEYLYMAEAMINSFSVSPGR